MVMSRYEFLARAHEILRPETYLEIGVQTGASLALAQNATHAIGIDPAAILDPRNVRPNQSVYDLTSDDFFRFGGEGGIDQVNLAYIDGSHLFEDALRDFVSVERLCGERSVIMLDDVLPYSEAIAARVQPPGDWTGDVWKMIYALQHWRPDLDLTLVDVAPTGLLIVTGVLNHPMRNDILADAYDKILEDWRDLERVPPQVLDRTQAIGADLALDILRGRRG